MSPDARHHCRTCDHLLDQHGGGGGRACRQADCTCAGYRRAPARRCADCGHQIQFHRARRGESLKCAAIGCSCTTWRPACTCGGYPGATRFRMTVAVPEDTHTEIDVTTDHQPPGQRHPSSVSADSGTTTPGSAAQVSCGCQGPCPVLAQGSAASSLFEGAFREALAWLTAHASRRSS